MARMILIAIGSSGDVHPILGIAEELAHRSHEVIVMTNPSFESLVKRLGFDFRPLGTSAEFDAVADDPDVWHPVRGFRLLARWAMLHTMRPIYKLLQELYLPGKTVVAAPLTAFGARIAQEKLGISLADPVVDRETNAFRRALGLCPVHRLLDRWCHSPERVIGLFPDWYAPPQADWPPNTRLTGFPLWDESVVVPHDAELQTFLQAQEPPLVFTPGSAMRHGKEFFEVAATTTRQLNQRAIFLSRHTAHIPANLPAGIVHFPYVPFSQLLPQAAALVHHGGIGSTAQALAAGIPQLIMAMAYDQPDNAQRVARLGVGGGLFRHQFRAPRVAKMLDRWLGCVEMAARCQRVAEHFPAARPIQTTANLIEQLLSAPPISSSPDRSNMR